MIPEKYMESEETIMKKHAGRLAAAAVALTLVTVCLLGGTLAKYATTVTGTGSATVAEWSFKANEKTDTFSVDLKDESGKTTDGKIAPGSKGSFKIKVDGTGSEVALDYSAVFSNIQGKPSALKFYSDEYMTEIADLAEYKGIKGSIGATDVDKVKEYTIYWQWPFNDASETVPETKAMSFNITVTGTQQAPETTAP